MNLHAGSKSTRYRGSPNDSPFASEEKNGNKTSKGFAKTAYTSTLKTPTPRYLAPSAQKIALNTCLGIYQQPLFRGIKGISKISTLESQIPIARFNNNEIGTTLGNTALNHSKPGMGSLTRLATTAPDVPKIDRITASHRENPGLA